MSITQVATIAIIVLGCLCITQLYLMSDLLSMISAIITDMSSTLESIGGTPGHRVSRWQLIGGLGRISSRSSV